MLVAADGAPRGLVAFPRRFIERSGRRMAARYELLITGPTSHLVTDLFEPCEELPAPPGRSRLVGGVEDEAALYGVLQRLQTLRIGLLELRRLDAN